MKLSEMEFTTTPKVIQKKRFSADLKSSFDKASGKIRARRLGQGYYADAYEKRTKPGVVTKVGLFHESPSKDGYLSYVRKIIHHNRAAANPFLPRIFSIKVYNNKVNQEGAEGGGEYVIQMEKLKPITDLSLQQLSAMADQLFIGGIPMDDKLKLAVEQDSKDEKGQRWLMDQILYTIAMAASSRYPRYVKMIRDKKLLQAVALISNLSRAKQHTDIEFDLHAGNFMYRMTPVGPQLVITDPLS